MNAARGPTDPLPRDRLGRPLHDLRISVIETCNFRCPYCMPEGLTPEETSLDRSRRLDFDEIETAVRAFARLGVSKLRLTGGEPLLRKNLAQLVARLAAIPGIDDLALTTNGSLLAGQALALREAGLHRLTISLDSLDAEQFRALSGGRGELADVLAGLAAAEAFLHSNGWELRVPDRPAFGDRIVDLVGQEAWLALGHPDNPGSNLGHLRKDLRRRVAAACGLGFDE